MTADEIRNRDRADALHSEFAVLVEIAAQLAELNATLNLLLRTPTDENRNAILIDIGRGGPGSIG